MNAKLSMVLISIAATIIASSIAFSDNAPNKGAKSIEIDGGTRGKVPFPHHRHQENLSDCTICHSIFPQKSGSIEALKTDGKLKKKYVMNKLCTKCHKETKKAGGKTGPTTCSKCHIKAKS
jgi:Cytochrome c7 and related cytochrome c